MEISTQEISILAQEISVLAQEISGLAQEISGLVQEISGLVQEIQGWRRGTFDGDWVILEIIFHYLIKKHYGYPPNRYGYQKKGDGDNFVLVQGRRYAEFCRRKTEIKLMYNLIK